MKKGDIVRATRPMENGYGKLSTGDLCEVVTTFGGQVEVTRIREPQISLITSQGSFEKVEENMNGKDIKRGQYIIGTVNKQTGNVSFANQPKVHLRYDLALEEAKRLAGSITDKKFMVVEVKAIASAVEVVVE